MATAADIPKIWCDEDGHRKYVDFADFNEWFDSAEGVELRVKALVEGLANPSKAFFAGDREAYNVTLEGFRLDRRNEWLSVETLQELFGDTHWSVRNAARFDQLCDRMQSGDVVPFVGAGLSAPGGFPTWKDHLRQQGRTAGMYTAAIEDLLAQGLYEEIVDQIEQQRGRDVFAQELRDAFAKNGVIPSTGYLVAELFQDTLITTNYDRLIEQSFDFGGGKAIEVLTPATILQPPEAGKVTVVKLHGNVDVPGSCILSKAQYAAAYGADAIDLTLPIPQALDYYFRNSSLLFIGCGLNQDRTVRVFEAIKIKAWADGANLPQHFSIEQCPADEAALIARNEYLLRIGVTPIWFPPGEFQFVEGILRLARNELRFRRE
ncbi:SIR2 family protein [Lysobacter sp. D1-1-M9]|uniref:SIR2 family protein n=1 Tax=Novilysobacter longmucuonensis TaxID=3098603 RepID=UPI002FC5FC31